MTETPDGPEVSTDQPDSQPTEVMSEPSAPGHSPRRRILIAAGVVLLAGGAAAAALLLTGGEKTKPKAKTTARALTPPSQTTAAAAAQPAVNEPAAREVLKRYVEAYNSEDAASLSKLLSQDVVRKGGDETQTGRDSVLAEYRRQFRILDRPKYRLLRLAVATDAKGATGTGGYQVSSDNGGGQGTIAFHLRSESGGIVIDRIDAEPKP
jgi:hypothetical protein